jgi:hypothetical protein
MMYFVANQFWGIDWDHNPPLTDAVIKDAEDLLGVILPLEYLDLLRIQNGGYTKGFVFPTEHQTTWAEDHVALDEVFGIGQKEIPSGIHNILNTLYMTKEWGLPPNQVLLAGDGHWWITLDYRKNRTPTVAWLDVEVGQDYQLAKSFHDFLDGLLPSDTVDQETCTLKRRQ